jgi:hypothetical protein
MNDDDFLNFFSWSFTLVSVFDAVYLLLFLKRFRTHLIVFLVALVLGTITYLVGSNDFQYSWDLFAELLLVLLFFGIIGCIIIVVTGIVSIKALQQHDYHAEVDLSRRLYFALHLTTLLINILMFYLVWHFPQTLYN